MNPLVAWALAAAVTLAAWQIYGARGLVLAVSAIAFLLLLQFNRTVRAMKVAAQNPLARVPSAVMFQAGLRPGLTMLQIVATTRSLGRKVDGSDDDWLWADEGGDSVRLHFEGARLATWQLERAA
jgi:Mg2+/Co2+ transporter CorB